MERKKGWIFPAGLACGLWLLRRGRRSDRELKLLREKQAALEEMTRKTQELAHHQRLQVIGTLTSGVAHEFNNLLTPIMGHSLMAMELLPAQEGELYDDLLEIYQASNRAKEIITRLSVLSRKGAAPAFHPIEPNGLVRKALKTLHPVGVEVETALECRGAWINGDETQLLQLLMNLILNACHAMESGGRLTVSTRISEGMVSILVADTGHGIPSEILPQIFEPFYTTKEAGTGTGLGLAIARQVAEVHEGTLTAESREGEGSVFTLNLPAVPPPGGGI